LICREKNTLQLVDKITNKIKIMTRLRKIYKRANDQVNANYLPKSMLKSILKILSCVFRILFKVDLYFAQH